MSDRIETDRVTLGILKSHFVAAAESMCHTLERTAHSTFIKESADYSAAIATPAGEIFAFPRNLGVTSFVGLNLATALSAFDDYEPGDIVITNDPYATDGLASHLPDIHMLKPVFAEGEIVAVAWCFIHCSDVGGLVPASISPDAYDISQEGMRIPPRKLYRAGELDREFLDLFLANCRTPEENWGDFKAMIASLGTAERRVHELVAKYGRDVIVRASEDVLTWTEQSVREQITTLPDGDFTFADYIDSDSDGLPVRIQVTLRIRGDEIVLDYDGTDPQVGNAYNVPAFGPRHPFLCQGLINFFLSHDPSMPVTGGVVRPLTNRTRPGTVVSPLFPAAVGVRYATAHRIYNVVLGALAGAVPDRVPAAGAGQAAIVAMSVPDPETGRRRVSVLQPMFGGGGATHRTDGVAGADSCAGYLKNTPIESMETTVPVLARRYELVPDSAGAGARRGGWGARFDFEVLRPDTIVTARGMERTRFAPWGAHGGQAASLTSSVVNEGTPGERRLGRIGVLHLDRGDTVGIQASGGGGYGDPLDRDPEAVREDVLTGLLAPARATEDYGVVLDGTTVDAEATVRERARRRKATPGFDLGRERTEHERLWPEETAALVARRLLTCPAALRPVLKRELHRLAREQDAPLTPEQVDTTLAGPEGNVAGTP
ncbi:hydantoinase B/oxoprolinase family protein [Amycolatopsis endophytica]|uniref:N-methylhydantoinase B n=1 Tax=Amycolatopsis endophytica TaxID=860233 RepID=A0A853BA00_9PSEU|nr:hydantoinase B/oxoprolinase family protein [Amycolatopsis endophytica]NYI91582.1 N-methylhydantoinase B [Amycolatopsis endophytica]